MGLGGNIVAVVIPSHTRADTNVVASARHQRPDECCLVCLIMLEVEHQALCHQLPNQWAIFERKL